jgi:Tol biopolymer transport system component
MNPDGTEHRRLTRGPKGRKASLVWSPDGRKLAFLSDGDHGDFQFDLYVMNAEGSGLRRLTRNPASDSAPAWSPSGRKIAFVSNRDGTYEVYVMNADGSGQLALGARTVGIRGALGDVVAPDDAPAWSPDGRKIAFVSNRDGTHEVYVMNADSGGQRRLMHRGA